MGLVLYGMVAIDGTITEAAASGLRQESANRRRVAAEAHAAEAPEDLERERKVDAAREVEAAIEVRRDGSGLSAKNAATPLLARKTFDKHLFVFQPEADRYPCPQGQPLLPSTSQTDQAYPVRHQPQGASWGIHPHQRCRINRCPIAAPSRSPQAHFIDAFIRCSSLLSSRRKGRRDGTPCDDHDLSDGCE